MNENNNSVPKFASLDTHAGCLLFLKQATTLLRLAEIETKPYHAPVQPIIVNNPASKTRIYVGEWKSDNYSLPIRNQA